MRLQYALIAIAIPVLAVFIFGKDEITLETFPDDIDISTTQTGVVPFPKGTPAIYTNVFSKYTKVVAPNGKPIHILIEDGWTDAQAVKGRNVLEHYLTSVPGLQYGSDKSAVANSIADQGAALIFANNWDSMETAGMRAVFDAFGGKVQNQHANEITVEGSKDYLEHKTRDASWEEIFHFVHDYGIKPVLPEYQKEIEAAEDAATARGFLGWPRSEPDNYPNEYYICVYDNYLNLWKAKPKVYEGKILTPADVPEGKSHFSAYPLADSREGVQENDPLGYAMIEKFLPPYITFTAALPADFNDVFWLRFHPDKIYTHKSQFLKDITLTGGNDSGVVGNQYDNVFTGNAGNNAFDGGLGNDVVVFSGPRSEYEITTVQDQTTVHDTTGGRDGTDILTGVERIQFSDEALEL
ncbi:hypothetical protein SAMN04488030_2155 [Aliiroseovarius halocynthiae]|uniref:Calcium-binding protein n=2 Tax=Aliiroseovarius halocynthiae TaxID=985055 RepID=A0A545SXW8_9RHOB|nr:hypothetical protein [Aliiroseovarius halocynthiae]TQV69804.1 hypothetical protein FIL88_01665 [Aliiroseovarius halocynthiae]SMR81726.1 hypothetical protein SAMN04488030_2155 [Aliiroseovarius halocynthiae]